MLIAPQFRSPISKRSSHQRGQAAVFVVLAMGIFLIGGVGFVVDGANLWFHRQTAQTAADAACNAGAMDMLSAAAGADLSGTPWTNSANAYAEFNGYQSSVVNISFPGTFAGIPPSNDCDYTTHTVCAATDLVSRPYMSVSVNDPVPTTFMRLVGAGPSTTVPARSTCGLSNVLSPVPVVVLNPNAPSGFDMNGVRITNALKSPGIFSVFGAPKSIQVNSHDGNAVDLTGGTVSLSNAVDDGNGEFAVAGRESESDAGGALSGKWVNAAGIISDPFASINVNQPSAAPAPQYGIKGCPGIPPGVSCDDYKPGYYPPLSTPCIGSIRTQAAICVGKKLVDANQTGLAVFEPGVYYLAEDFYADGSSCLRSATTAGDRGTMFYLSGLAVLNVRGGSGSSCAIPPVPATEATCTGGDGGLGNLGVSQLTGNVLLAPCTGKYGDPTGAGNRGILFFHDRDVQPDQPYWAGSGALVGNVYLHYCHSALPGGSGADCDPTNAFTETLRFDAGSNVYIVGGIVVDQLDIESGADIKVVLNPARQYYVLKASLLQ
jgi:putative Flp pilus-assembly TadE/G-like protein